MSTLDIRKNEDSDISAIQFDESDDRITGSQDGVRFSNAYSDEWNSLCSWEDLENLIAALQKARELWGPK